MNKLETYQNILRNLEETYKAKDNDYGNSVGYTYKKYGDVSFLVRITDKFNRIESLTDPKHNITVKEEKLEDTVLDLANYCLLWLVEREQSKTINANTITSGKLFVPNDIIAKAEIEPIPVHSGVDLNPTVKYAHKRKRNTEVVKPAPPKNSYEVEPLQSIDNKF